MTKFCGQVNIPTVNNDPIACNQFYNTDCVIYQNPIAYFGTNDPSTSTEVFDFIISSLIDARTRLGTVEGTILPTTHADLLGLAADDHLQYHTDGRALTWLGTRSTTDLPEGTNEYFTEARVLSSVLAGFNPALTGAVVATDTVLEGFGKLQYQIDNAGATWGAITGTLSSQTDLQSALDAKLSLSGGTMTGSISFNTDTIFVGDVANPIGSLYAKQHYFEPTSPATKSWKVTSNNGNDSLYFEAEDTAGGNTHSVQFSMSDTGSAGLLTDVINRAWANSNLVDRVSSQTVGGLKTFTSPVHLQGGSVIFNDSPSTVGYASGGAMGYLGTSQYYFHQDHLNAATAAGVLDFDSLTVDRIYTFPDKAGTVALLDDITGGGQVDSVVAGTNITVDNTDPANPIVSAAGGAFISDAGYGAAWNGNTTDGASKNAIYDQIETLVTLGTTQELSGNKTLAGGFTFLKGNPSSSFVPALVWNENGKINRFNQSTVAGNDLEMWVFNQEFCMRKSSQATNQGMVITQANTAVRTYTFPDKSGTVALLDDVTGGGQVNSIVAGTNITVDATDPANPIVSAAGGADNLGNHTATQTLDMASNALTNVLSISMEGDLTTEVDGVSDIGTNALQFGNAYFKTVVLGAGSLTYQGTFGSRVLSTNTGTGLLSFNTWPVLLGNTTNATSSGVVTRIGRTNEEEIWLRPAVSEVGIYGGTGGSRIEVRVQSSTVRGIGVTTAGIDANADALITRDYADTKYGETTGTFTPTLTAETSGSYSNGGASGSYTRIGNLVYFNILFNNVGSTSPTGRLLVGGFPFTLPVSILNATVSVGATSPSFSSLVAVAEGGTTISFTRGANGASNDIVYENVVFPGGTQLQITGITPVA